jgi:acetyl-CoA carboxylase biotin carboxyl carrier protein
VNIGDTIKPGDVLCVVEAMKLFNEIESEVSGKIVKVLVDDSTPVEYDQPLFLVDPS